MAVLNFYKRYSRIIWASIGCFILLLFILFMFDYCSGWSDRREIDRLNKNINGVQSNINGVRENLSNLSIENRLQSENLNRLATNHNSDKNATDEARDASNRALENVWRIENGNFNNVNLTEAEKARCVAFPESCR